MLAELSRIMVRIMSMIGRGRLTAINDDGPVQTVQVHLGNGEVRDNTPRLCEYGFQSNPPPGTDCLVVFLSGDRSNGAVIGTNSQQYRLSSLPSGDVAISDNRGHKVHLTSAGILIVGDATLTGNLIVNGNTTLNGTVTANGHAIDETHVHHSGAGFTGVVA